MKRTRLSPSAAHRWLLCPGSVLFSEQFEKQETPAANDGILAHDVAAAALTQILQGSSPSLERVQEDWVTPILEYVAYCKALAEEAVVLGIEERVSIEPLVGEEGASGVCDFFSIKGDTLHVVDFKFGQGELVSAREEDGGVNPQLAMYALGVANDYDYLGGVERVMLHIVQPRRGHYSTAELTLQELDELGEKIRRGAQLTRERPNEYNPDPKACRWCPGKAHCSARAQAAAAQLGVDVNTIGPAELGEYLQRVAEMRKWCDDIEERAVRDISERRPVPGWKLVAGRGVRKWSPDAESRLFEVLGDDALRVEKRLITVTEAEKILGKKHELLQTLTLRDPGAPKLVRESDPRPPLLLDAASEFVVEQSEIGDDNGR